MNLQEALEHLGYTPENQATREALNAAIERARGAPTEDVMDILFLEHGLIHVTGKGGGGEIEVRFANKAKAVLVMEEQATGRRTFVPLDFGMFQKKGGGAKDANAIIAGFLTQDGFDPDTARAVAAIAKPGHMVDDKQ